MYKSDTASDAGCKLIKRLARQIKARPEDSSIRDASPASLADQMSGSEFPAQLGACRQHPANVRIWCIKLIAAVALRIGIAILPGLLPQAHCVVLVPEARRAAPSITLVSKMNFQLKNLPTVSLLLLIMS